jgi:hypothetical protein
MGGFRAYLKVRKRRGGEKGGDVLKLNYTKRRRTCGRVLS